MAFVLDASVTMRWLTKDGSAVDLVYANSILEGWARNWLFAVICGGVLVLAYFPIFAFHQSKFSKITVWGRLNRLRFRLRDDDGGTEDASDFRRKGV
jgi:hypothetical protein